MTVSAKKPDSRDLVSAVLFLKLSASEKLVLMALCWHYPNIFPSVARIAAMASRSERWVQRCLRILQGKGLIEVHYRRDGQAQDTSFYTICPDRILMQAALCAWWPQLSTHLDDWCAWCFLDTGGQPAQIQNDICDPFLRWP